jgi:hypothetical protein
MVRIDVEDCTSSYLGFHNSACVVSHDGEYSNTLLISKGACWFFMAMSELDSALEFHTCSRSSTYAQSWVFELTFSLRSSLSHILCWCIGPWNHIRRFRIAELARPLSGSGIANHCLGLCSFLLPFRFSRRVSIPVSRRQGHCKAESYQTSWPIRKRSNWSYRLQGRRSRFARCQELVDCGKKSGAFDRNHADED